VVRGHDRRGVAGSPAAAPQPGGAGGPHDQWGPGTRIPAITISKAFAHSGVDHTEHDTTSIMATIEHWKGLAPTNNANRDAKANDLASAVYVGLHGNH